MGRADRNRARQGTPRSRTLSATGIVVVEDTSDVDDWKRPKTRGECPTGPCPWIGCKYHLLIDVDPRTGALKLNFPDLEFDQMKQTCALTVADAGQHTLDEVGELMNVTRERTRQNEAIAAAKLLKPLLQIDPDRVVVPMADRITLAHVVERALATDERRDLNRRARERHHVRLANRKGQAK